MIQRRGRGAPVVAVWCCGAVQVVAFVGLVLSVAFTPSYSTFGWLHGEGWIAVGLVTIGLIPTAWLAIRCIPHRGTRLAGILVGAAMVAEAALVGLYLALWHP